MGCGSSCSSGSCGCGSGGCGGNCSCGGDCACDTGHSEPHPHRFCTTCGEEHDGPDALFDHNQKQHNLPEPNHCPVCGEPTKEHVDDGENEQRAWMKMHLANGDENHKRYLQLQPF